MRWFLIVLLMCNGIYFLWQNYLLQGGSSAPVSASMKVGASDAGIVLLSELGVATLAPVASGEDLEADEARSLLADEKVLIPVAAEPVAEPGICWLIGPFMEVVSGKQVVARLSALDISLGLQNIEVAGKPDYWVHLPPQVSRKAAVKLLRELQVKKIDSFLITEGELANGISLGFFTQESRAQAVFDQRIRQGYNPVIKVVPRSHTEIWAVFNAGEYSKLSDVLWEKIKEGNKGLERRKNYCDKIASTDNFD